MYSTKFCPVLSAAMIRPKEPSLLVGSIDQSVPKAELDLIPCQGPLCGFWLPIGDEAGVAKEGAGSCAVTLLPLAVRQVTEVLNNKREMKYGGASDSD